jgi:hypothetical protein
MPNLRELMDDYAMLAELLNDDTLTEDRATELLDMLDDAKGTLAVKVDNTIRVLENLQAGIDAFKVEEKRLAARRKTMENNRERIRNWIRESMVTYDVNKLKTEFHTVRIDPGKPKVIVLDDAHVPDEYRRVKIDVDKTKVMSTYKEDGEIVAGCDIITSEPRLVIR